MNVSAAHFLSTTAGIPPELLAIKTSSDSNSRRPSLCLMRMSGIETTLLGVVGDFRILSSASVQHNLVFVDFLFFHIFSKFTIVDLAQPNTFLPHSTHLFTYKSTAKVKIKQKSFEFEE